MDLFDFVYSKVGCAMLSDIKFEPYRRCACEKVSLTKLDNFPLCQFQDLAEYLFGEKIFFADYSEVKDYFADKCK